MLKRIIKDSHFYFIFKGNFSFEEEKSIANEVCSKLRHTSLDSIDNIISIIESMDRIPQGSVRVTKDSCKITIKIKL